MRARVHIGLSLLALAVLAGRSPAQVAYSGGLVQQQFDPNAINAMFSAQQAARNSGGHQVTGRFRYIASVTGSGSMTQPLQVVNQFGPGAYSNLANISPFGGASGIAGGAAVGVALAAQSNLIHEPAGVQVNAMYNSPLSQRWGLNMASPYLGNSAMGGFGMSPFGGIGMNPYSALGASSYGGFGLNPYSSLGMH
jgi:hypothetical protein